MHSIKVAYNSRLLGMGIALIIILSGCCSGDGRGIRRSTVVVVDVNEDVTELRSSFHTTNGNLRF